MRIDEARRQLHAALAGFGMREAAERARVDPHAELRRFAAHEHLLRAGEPCPHVFFVCRGLVRFYYLTAEGAEHNKSFALENGFAGGMQLTERPEPARHFLQALEPTTALVLPLRMLAGLYETSLAWANLGRRYMESVAVRKSRREAELLLDSATARYRRFVAEEPELARRLPLKHVASYLGVTDVALSRIRRRLRAA